uniref:Modification methylase BabI n=1 Tax=Lygus hesperus TaxID=30085 RepID=A0A0A9ZCZ8_LYGHE
MVPAPNYWYPGLGKSSLTQSSASHFRAVGVVQLYQDPSGSSSETEEDIPEKIYPVPTEKEQVPDETTSSGDKVLVTPKPGSDEYNSHQSSEQPGNPVVIPPKTGSGEYGKQPSNVKPNDPKKSTKSSEQHAPKTKVDSGDVSNEEVLQNKLRHLS